MLGKTLSLSSFTGINVESYMRSMGLMVKARIILTDEGLELEVIPDDDDEAKYAFLLFKWVILGLFLLCLFNTVHPVSASPLTS